MTRTRTLLCYYRVPIAIDVVIPQDFKFREASIFNIGVEELAKVVTGTVLIMASRWPPLVLDRSGGLPS